MLIRGIYSQQRRRWMREIKIDRKFLSLNTSAHNLLSFSSSAFINILLFDHHHKKCIQRCCFSSRNNRYKKKSSNSHMRIVRCVHGVRYCLNKMQNCHKAKITHTFFINIGCKYQQSSSSSLKQFQNWKFTIYIQLRAMCGIWCKKKEEVWRGDTLNNSSLMYAYERAARIDERWRRTFIDLFIRRWQLKHFTIFHHSQSSREKCENWADVWMGKVNEMRRR